MSGSLRLKYEEETRYLMREFYNKFEDKLPAIFAVMMGQIGESCIEEFGTGDYVWVKTTSHQNRAIAHDSYGRYLTIPMDFKGMFSVVTSQDEAAGPAMSIKDLVMKETLPKLVRFSAVKSIDMGIYERNPHDFFGNIVVTGTFEETYLMGNYIWAGYHDSCGREDKNRPYEDWVGTDKKGCQLKAFLSPKPIVVPLYLDMPVSLCTTTHDDDSELWEDFNQYLTEKSEHHYYDPTRGNPEIAIYSEEAVKEAEELGENVYEYISPKTMDDIKESAAGRRRQDVTKFTPSTQHRAPPPIPGSSLSSRAPVPKSRSLPGPPKCESELKKSKSGSFFSKIRGHKKDKKSATFYDCGQPVQKIDMEPKQFREADSDADDAGDYMDIDDCDYSSAYEKPQEFVDKRKLFPGIKNKESTPKEQNLKNSIEDTEIIAVNKINAYSGFPKVLPPVPVKPKKPDVTTPQDVHVAVKVEGESPETISFGSCDTSERNCSDTSISSATSATGRNDAGRSPQFTITETQKECISNLTIDEVCAKLGDLKLHKYANKFKEEQIDGQMLLHMDADMLKEDFGFKRVEVLKLLLFIRQSHTPG